MKRKKLEYSENQGNFEIKRIIKKDFSVQLINVISTFGIKLLWSYAIKKKIETVGGEL